MSNRDSKAARPAIAGRVVGRGAAEIWGMSSEQRLQRLFARLGIAVEAGSADGQVLVRADFVTDEALIRDLAVAPRTALTTEDGAALVAVHAPAAEAGVAATALIEGNAAGLPQTYRLLPPSALSSSYNAKLRKRMQPLLEPLTAAKAPMIEARMFTGAYKGATDLVTKYVWPRPALTVTRWCARAGISPNAVTWVSLGCVIAAFWLFWQGAFIAGLAFAWMMCFLDTVDGKLARVTLTSTKLGDVFDHGIDLVHPPFWYYAWGVGLSGPTLTPEIAALVAVIVAGYVIGRLQEGFFIWRFGLEIHIWRPVDTWFRLITARRNPNLILLMAFAMVGRPDLGLWSVALWTAASLGFHFLRIAQAAVAKRRGPIASWLAEPA
ncbi:CDP-alcohol phosphatidyltransferase family protein [Desertibaculum subflavum]|uniref:CDP-alcohol phosphatidyltransferase family protein n=1 Tax=Desertibaculum subflavum TaxID=2268458 RepID=UPI000E66B905